MVRNMRRGAARPSGEGLVLNRFVLGLMLGAAFGGLLSCFILTPVVGLFIGAVIGVSCGMILHVWMM
jgi:F0F1-type ATP synthase assembly protein I